MKALILGFLAACGAATAGAQEAANPVRTVGALDDLIAQRGAGRLIGVPRTEQGSGFEPYGLACGTLKPGDFVHSLGDTHLYSNHLEQARLQLTRPTRPLPVMKINPDVKDILAFRFEDFRLEGYDPHPHIKAEVAV